MALRQRGVTFTPAFVVLGAALWVSLHAAGVHPTWAGVAMGLLAPATPRMSRGLHRFASLAVIPVFALGNPVCP